MMEENTVAAPAYSPELLALVDDITRKRREDLERRIHTSDQTNFHASSIGFPCERYLYHLIANGRDMRTHDIGTQAVFNEGNVHEKEILMLLLSLGFKVVGMGDRRDYQLKDTVRKISMKLDAYIEQGKRHVPVEVKSCSTYYYDDIKTEADIRESDRVYVRSWYDQMNLYLFGSNQEEGIFILKNRNNGDLKIIPVRLDWERADALVKKAERIDRAIAAGEPPAMVDWSAGLCAGCRARPHLCNPDELRNATKIWTDEEFISMLKRRQVLIPLVSEYNTIEKKIKEVVKGVDGVIAGPFYISGQWRHREAEKKIRDGYDFWDKKIELLGDAGEVER